MQKMKSLPIDNESKGEGQGFLRTTTDRSKLTKGVHLKKWLQDDFNNHNGIKTQNSIYHGSIFTNVLYLFSIHQSSQRYSS